MDVRSRLSWGVSQTTMNCRIIFLGCLVAACQPTAAQRDMAERRAAGVRLAAYAESTRAAFRRLPTCPPSRASKPAFGPLSIQGVPIPPSFVRDSGVQFAHGGYRFTSGDTIVEIAYGHFGLASFTGRYDGGGKLPSGCVARVGNRTYMVTERVDSSGFRASAVHVADTLQVYGQVLFGIAAPRSVRDWLLALLQHRAPAG